jgi:thiamine biosynthesis protein ThiS
MGIGVSAEKLETGNSKLLECLLMKLVINGEERSFDDGLTLAALVEQLGVKADRIAVELNRDIVRRDDWAGTTLRNGDRLEVVHFVGGGLRSPGR